MPPVIGYTSFDASNLNNASQQELEDLQRFAQRQADIKMRRAARGPIRIENPQAQFGTGLPASSLYLQHGRLPSAPGQPANPAEPYTEAAAMGRGPAGYRPIDTSNLNNPSPEELEDLRRFAARQGRGPAGYRPIDTSNLNNPSPEELEDLRRFAARQGRGPAGYIPGGPEQLGKAVGTIQGPPADVTDFYIKRQASQRQAPRRLPQQQEDALIMQATQPGVQWTGSDLITRRIDAPAIAQLASGQPVERGTMLFREDITPMDPISIVRRIAGERASTPEERALAFEIFDRLNRGYTGLLGEQNQAEQARQRLGLEYDRLGLDRERFMEEKSPEALFTKALISRAAQPGTTESDIIAMERMRGRIGLRPRGARRDGAGRTDVSLAPGTDAGTGEGPENISSARSRLGMLDPELESSLSRMASDPNKPADARKMFDYIFQTRGKEFIQKNRDLITKYLNELRPGAADELKGSAVAGQLETFLQGIPWAITSAFVGPEEATRIHTVPFGERLGRWTRLKTDADRANELIRALYFGL